MLSACQPAQDTPATPSTPEDSQQLEAQPASQPLDLSREHLQGVDTAVDGSGEEPQAALPAMFDKPADPKKVKVGGSLLTDKEAATLQDSIDGVEFKLEVRTP